MNESPALAEAQTRRPYSDTLPAETYNSHYRAGFVEGAEWRRGLRWEDPCPLDPQGHNTRGPFVCDNCGAVDIQGMWTLLGNLETEVAVLTDQVRDRDKTITFLKDWLTSK